MKLIDLLENSAADHPQRAAIRSQTLELSYGRMRSDVNRLAEQLTRAGCRQGTQVAIVFDNCPEYMVSFFAISAAGGTIVPLHRRMTTYEIQRQIIAGDVSIVIANSKYAKQLVAVVENQKPALVAVDCNKADEMKIEAFGAAAIESDYADGDVALMVPTSGTTGQPKIVMLTDSQLISNMQAYTKVVGFDTHNVAYCAIPMHHIYCICAQMLTHISRADTFIVKSGPFFIKDFAGAAEQYNVTATAFVPSIAALLAGFPQSGNRSVASLRYVTLSGSRTPASIYRTLTRKYERTQFINTYGMSEAGSRISIAAPCPQNFPIESVGRPVPGVQVRITDENNAPLSAEAAGEIQVKSSGVMKGYYKQPELTKETIVDGWLRTGDIGKLDENGNLFILGRKKNIIITGGENVYPDEIEECLLDHPAIKEAAVVASPDGILEEVPYAFIVARSAEKPAPVEVISFCRKRLSAHKVPRRIEYLDVLPRTDTFKTDRRKLEQMAAVGTRLDAL